MAQINFTAFRGLADSKWSALKGTFPKCVGLNIHDTPGIITPNQKLTLDSPSSGGNDVDALCRVSLALSTNIRLWFSYTSGKIWAESSGTYTLVYTTSPAAGTAGCFGAAEYNSFVYWGTQSRLHRIAIASATATAADWTTGAVPNWQTFTGTDDEFHPMRVVNQTLFIGDANNIASVNSSATFTASALNLIAPNRVKCLAKFDIDLVIGTVIENIVNESWVIRWDTVQTSWQFAEPVRENGVNSFLWLGNALIAQAGTSGNFYIYDGQFLQPFKRLPGIWTPTRYGEVYPEATAVFRGIPVFGFSNSQDAANSTGDPADSGVYTMGRYSKDYPIVINGPEYVISENSVSDVQVGSILVVGNDMYVSWERAGETGIDQVDYTAKYASAYMEFPVITTDPIDFASYGQYIASYASLPASTSVTFLYDANNAGSFTTIASGQHYDDTNADNYYAIEKVEARSFQLRVNFTVSGNNAPQISMFTIIVDG